MVAFYKPKQAELLHAVPSATTVTIDQAALGEYDTVKKVFPVNGPGGRPKRVELYKQSPTSASTVVNYGNQGNACMDAMAIRTLTQKTSHSLGDVYVFNIAEGMSFDQVPVPMDAARKYLDSTPGNRTVRFDAQFELADAAEPIVKSCPDTGPDGSLRSNVRLTCIEFPAKLKTVQVIKAGNARELGWGKVIPDQILAVLYP
jgi:hypothetical protein